MTRPVVPAIALALLLLPAPAPPARASDPEPLPLGAPAGDLLGSVDSASVSVLSVIAIAPPSTRQAAGAKQRRLIGTGVVLGDHRIITTASMAIDGGTFRAVPAGGAERHARLRGVDRASNVALLEVDGGLLPALRRAPPQSLAVGAWVAVIANTGIGRSQITLGRVTGRGERVDYPYSGEVLELDAPAYPGAGGGAVLNEDGEWVAVVVGRAVRTAGRAPVAPADPAASVEPARPEGVLVALPVDQLDRIAEDLETYGAVRRGFLGIRLRKATGPEDSLGISVQGVVPGSPAEQAGIRTGDVILALEGEYVRTPEELTLRVRAMRPGDEVALTLSRGDDIMPVSVTIGAAVPAAVAAEGGDDAELRDLTRRLERLEAESRAVRERIRSLKQSGRR